MKLVAAALAALVLAAASSPQHSPEAQAKLDKELAGRVAGETKHCIPVEKTGHPIGIDDTVLLFRDGPRVWQTNLTGSFQCGLISKQSTIATESGGQRLCAGDKLTFFDNGNPMGACYLGEFTPYTKP